jgi:hypothetical protein
VADILHYQDPRPRTVETLSQPGFIAAKKLSMEIFQREVRKPARTAPGSLTVLIALQDPVQAEVQDPVPKEVPNLSCTPTIHDHTGATTCKTAAIF